MENDMSSPHFESFHVKGDKITIHKCVLDKAIKMIKNDPDPFEDGDVSHGMVRILEELVECIDQWNYREQTRWCDASDSAVRRWVKKCVKKRDKGK